MTTTAWHELVLTVPAAEAQAVADAVLPFAYGGVVLEPAIRSEPGSEEYTLALEAPSQVKVYLPLDSGFDENRRRLLDAARGATAQLDIRERSIVEADWADAWKRHVKPVRIGQRLLVRPPWSRVQPAPGAAVVELEPGMAFGTGDHPTTRACLRALVYLLTPGARVLDLGTGSGILAVAAVKLGASRVLALDTDPLAVAAAREACLRNGVGEQVAVVQGSIDAPEARDWRPDLLLANLTSRLHQELAGEIACAMPTGGTLVAAGIGEAALDAVLAAYRQAGAKGVRVRRDAPWRSLRWTKVRSTRFSATGRGGGTDAAGPPPPPGRAEARTTNGPPRCGPGASPGRAAEGGCAT